MEWDNEGKDDTPADWLPMVEIILNYFQENPPSPTLFYKLTTILKTLNYDQITELFTSISPTLWSSATMSFLRLGTEPSMELVYDLLRYGDMPYSELASTVTYLLQNFETNDALIDVMKVKYQAF